MLPNIVTLAKDLFKKNLTSKCKDTTSSFYLGSRFLSSIETQLVKKVAKKRHNNQVKYCSKLCGTLKFKNCEHNPHGDISVRQIFLFQHEYICNSGA